MADFKPRQIVGKWRDGYALDLHTLSSTYIGDNEFGHPQFDTKRPEIGELLYKLKYDRDETVVGEIVDAAGELLRSKGFVFDVIVPYSTFHKTEGPSCHAPC